jgi:small multidrug resistance pump
MSHPYLLLLAAVTCETFGTACLQASRQFTRLWPTLGVALGFACAFWLLAQTLKYLPLGVVYALWSGLGIVFITIIGIVVFRQTIDLPAILGMGMIVAGIAVIHLFSSATPY